MELVLKPEDFINLGLVAPNCNVQKLNIAINEAFDFDLCNEFKECHVDVKQIIKKVLLYIPESEEGEPSEIEIKLVNGNVFTEDSDTRGIQGIPMGGLVGDFKTFENLGLKRGLIYYAYSRYLLINEFNDSAVGQKTQNFNFSVPKTHSEIKSMSDKYRNMAKAAMLSSYEWIAKHKDEFKQLSKCLDLKHCYCNRKDDKSFCDVNTTGYQLRGRNIKRD